MSVVVVALASVVTLEGDDGALAGRVAVPEHDGAGHEVPGQSDVAHLLAEAVLGVQHLGVGGGQRS